MRLPFLRPRREQPARPPGRRPFKADSLARLKRLGVPIEAVLDVGVKNCTAELIEAFPDKHHLLMEPVVEWNADIEKHYAPAVASYEIVNVAVSNRDGEIGLKTRSVYDDDAITHAHMVKDVGEGPSFRVVPMRTLDSIMAERAIAGPYLLKIDVDGAELAVIGGASQTLASCSVVIVEVGITNMIKRSKALERAGFQIFDIVDICYYDDRFVQADMVFLSTEIINARKLGVYQDGFDINKWAAYNPS